MQTQQLQEYNLTFKSQIQIFKITIKVDKTITTLFFTTTNLQYQTTFYNGIQFPLQ